MWACFKFAEAWAHAVIQQEEGWALPNIRTSELVRWPSL
jgi:hypothetical protein